MQSVSVNYTIAEYCQQYDEKTIVINRNYQRSPKIWPPSARSYLIDTILSGYPMPKILLRQRTDLQTRRTYKEVVDGQQRTMAIVDFFHDDLIITRGEFRGKRLSTLDEDLQHKFLSYSLSADLFPEATDQDIRQVFRRINSYTVPLNPQELRYARYQGSFKWFIARLSTRYAQTLKDLGVFSEAQLSRMADSELLTEVIRAFTNGIESSSAAKLNEMYSRFDDEFPQEGEMEDVVDRVFSTILQIEGLRESALMPRFNFYSLATAIGHALRRFPSLPEFPVGEGLSSMEAVAYNLLALAEAVDSKDAGGRFGTFVSASSSATNRREQRTTRFGWMCRALLPDLL